jgi:hypothetical protein
MVRGLYGDGNSTSKDKTEAFYRHARLYAGHLRLCDNRQSQAWVAGTGSAMTDLAMTDLAMTIQSQAILL